MKKILNYVLTCAIFMLALVNSAYAQTITETIDPANTKNSLIEDGSFLIGITKFEPDVIITARRVADAAFNDVLFNFGNNDYKGVEIYYLLLGDWYTFDEDNQIKPVNDEKLIEQLNNADIYYVNNEEKMLEIPYSKTISDEYEFEFRTDNYNKDEQVKLENGKLLVPATVNWVDIYAKNKETKELSKLSSFFKDESNEIDFETLSNKGTIEGVNADDLDYTVDGDTIIVDGNLKFVNSDYSLQNGRKAGNYAAVKITAPELYEYYEISNAQIKISDREYSLAWFEVIQYEESSDSFVFYPRFDSETKEITVTIEWVNENTQTFTIKLAETATLEEAPKADISYLFGLSVDPVINGNTVNVNEGVVSWYKADASVGRTTPGNRFGIKITAPEEYTYDEYKDAYITRKMYYSDSETPVEDGFVWKNVQDADDYFGIWPLVTDTLEKVVLEIEWEVGNTQVITINIADDVSLEEPYGAEISYLFGLSVDPVIDGNTVNVNEGVVSWYKADASVGRYNPGNRFGIKITAPEEYTYDEYKDAYITRKMYYSDSENPVEDWFVWKNVQDADDYFGIWPLVTDTLEKVVLEIEWEVGNTQVITINIADEVTLEEPAGATISYLFGLSVDPVIDGNTVNVNEGVVSWYKADASVGRTTPGNRFGIKITAPEEYTYDEYQYAQITRKMYYSDSETPVEDGFVWQDVQDADDYFGIWPLVTDTLEKVELSINWEEGNNQVITINIADEVTLEEPYGATISYLGGLSVKPTIDGNTVNVNEGVVSWYKSDASVGRTAPGNRIGFKITAPAEYTYDEYKDVSIYRKMYYTDSEKNNEFYMTWSQVQDSNTHYETWPVITDDLEKIELVIEWEYGNTQVITINIADNVSLEEPAGATLSYLFGLSVDPVITGNTVNVNEGVVDWYPIDTTLGRNIAGNRFGIKVTAPEEYTYDEYKDVSITRKMYYSDSETPVEDGFVWKDAQDADDYFGIWPLVTDTLEKVVLEIEWEVGNTQVITINIADGITFAEPYSGTISYLGGLSVKPTISGNTVNINEGTVSWYEADTNVGRNDAGNRFGFKITAPEEYEYEAYKNAEITRNMYYTDSPDAPTSHVMSWAGVQDSNTHYETWPLVNGNLIKIEIVIKWEEGNTQVFTINVDEAVTLEESAN